MKQQFHLVFLIGLFFISSITALGNDFNIESQAAAVLIGPGDNTELEYRVKNEGTSSNAFTYEIQLLKPVSKSEKGIVATQSKSGSTIAFQLQKDGSSETYSYDTSNIEPYLIYNEIGDWIQIEDIVARIVPNRTITNSIVAIDNLIVHYYETVSSKDGSKYLSNSGWSEEILSFSFVACDNCYVYANVKYNNLVQDEELTYLTADSNSNGWVPPNNIPKSDDSSENESSVGQDSEAPNSEQEDNSEDGTSDDSTQNDNDERSSNEENSDDEIENEDNNENSSEDDGTNPEDDENYVPPLSEEEVKEMLYSINVSSKIINDTEQNSTRVVREISIEGVFNESSGDDYIIYILKNISVIHPNRSMIVFTPEPFKIENDAALFLLDNSDEVNMISYYIDGEKNDALPEYVLDMIKDNSGIRKPNSSEKLEISMKNNFTSERINSILQVTGMLTLVLIIFFGFRLYQNREYLKEFERGNEK